MHSLQKSQGQVFAFQFSQKSFQKELLSQNPPKRPNMETNHGTRLGVGGESTTALHIQQARKTFQSESQTPTSPSS